jgi:hypothetical protein
MGSHVRLEANALTERSEAKGDRTARLSGVNQMLADLSAEAPKA